MSEEIDWDQASKAEKQCLYQAAKTFKDRENISWDKLFLDAFGLQDRVGKDYADNARRGGMAGSKAYKLFAHLNKHAPALASDVEDEILAIREQENPPDTPSWRALLQHAHFEKIRVFKANTSLSIITRKKAEPIYPLKLKLGDEFYFEVISPFAGTLTAFQSYRGKWYPLPLFTDENVGEITKGSNLLPAAREGKPEPLCEETDIGKHGFAFLITKQRTTQNLIHPSVNDIPHAIPPAILDKSAQEVLAMPKDDWAIFRVNVMVK